MTSTATERYEMIGQLYYACTGYLRPGKSEPAETGRDSNSDENRERFDHWMATACFVTMLDRLVFLERRKEELLQRIDELENQ